MTATSRRKKTISFCFRGFDMVPSDVEELVGLKASLILEKGKPVRPGMKTLVVRSAISYRIEVESDFRVAEMIPKLFDHLGGVDRLIGARDTVQPEFLEINLALPVKRSKEQEGGALERETIAELARLGASVSFTFL